jgi:lysophospholipase L1-like esterase
MFLAITVFTPVAVLCALELGLRLFWATGAMPLFGPSLEDHGNYRAARADVARRYFPDEQFPPAPPHDLFAAAKPANGFRVFVLGESSAAGFPYPRNGTFSRVLRDALRDVLPTDSVEVVNVGIAATNSYTMLDLANDVIAERPDAVLIYGGHNEYYGALGVGSSVRIAGSPALVRLYVQALHWRTVVLLRSIIGSMRHALAHHAPDDVTVASFMETVVRDQRIALGSPRFIAGEQQFDANLRLLLGHFRNSRIPVFIGSLASNLRDQPPLASEGNAEPAGADAVFHDASAALARGDTTAARTGFVKARDLDMVRFRAPSSFNGIIRAAAEAHGAVYVPVAEAFDSVAPGHLPGRELFLEHVHPTRSGYVLMASTFYQSLRAAHFLGHLAQENRLASWAQYEERMALSPFDERVAYHTTQSITKRWPFVPVAQQVDYRGTYKAISFADSTALLVARGGIPWEQAKVLLTEQFIARAQTDSALLESRGLIRDAPLESMPQEMAARALLLAGRESDAEPYLRAAYALQPSVMSTLSLATLAAHRRDFPTAIRFYLENLQLQPSAANTMYQLSVTYALTGDIVHARQYATQAAATQPNFPGLADWMTRLGMSPVH